MSTLKDALVRVSRVVRPAGPPRKCEVPMVILASTKVAPKHTKRAERPRIPQQTLRQVRPQLSGYLRKRYQKFLAPLEMPQLKIYDQRLEAYDTARAEQNLSQKTDPDRLQAFARFLGERQAFDRMVEVLVDLTPSLLMDAECVANDVELRRVLRREEEQFRVSRQVSVPRFHFHEVPPMPQPLTKQSFYDYIYFLTHSRLLYRNSSSLMSGIVPEILLYTHSLENGAFKPFRSAETYTCLIKYFGYDKFQNSFARELLLVMVKDGHKPTVNTINQLLKICRIHRSRRSIVSTYKVVANYLHLAKQLGIPLNLSTWNRVYDCIDNIFLKEAFLNKMLAVSLPVLDNMCIRILEDFCLTTPLSTEVVHFLEHDLRRPFWKQDLRLVDKVLYHKIRHMESNSELGSVFLELWPQIATDALSLKAVANAIDANARFTHKAYLLLCMYNQLSPESALVAPEVYTRVVQLLSTNTERYSIPALTKFARGIIHHDARIKLNLPVETVDYESLEEALAMKKKASVFPYKMPRVPFSEHYRIFKRLSQNTLNVLEAKVMHHNKVNPEQQISEPWVMLSTAEESAWHETVATLKTHQDFWINSAEKAATLGLIKCKRLRVPPRAIYAYEKYNNMQMRLSNEINTVKKLLHGLDSHLELEMRERNIYSPDLALALGMDLDPSSA